MRSKKKTIILFSLMYLFFVGLMDYPFVTRLINQYNQGQVIVKYQNDVNSISNLESVRINAQAYNEKLASGKTAIVAPFDNEDTNDTDYFSQLAINADGTMCTIRIPIIDVTLPVYHGVNDSVLQAGAGHLPGTSLPVGGESTHCCISAHRGLPNKTMFTNLDLLTEGDRIYLDVPGDTLAYEVYEIEVVLPTNIDPLKIRKGEDLLTLITCTPYGINTHRLYVHAKRVPYNPGSEQRISRENWLKLNWWILATIFLLFFLAFLIRWYLKPEKKNEYKTHNKNNTPKISKKRKRITVSLYVFFYLFFICVMDYPFVARMINAQTQATVVNEFREGIENEPLSRLEQEAKDAREYNRCLANGIYAVFGESETADLNDKYFSLLAFNPDKTMCTIRIPKIDVDIPVYHGTSSDVLSVGAGHLQGTSLPVGGESTHCCISAHRGLPGRVLFTNLDLLEKGDHIYIDSLGGTLKYVVTGREDVLPDNIKPLAIKKGEDLLTLITCTPYGVNTHRMYVHARRDIPYIQKEDSSIRVSRMAWILKHWWKFATVMLLILMLAMIRNYLKSFEN